MKSVQFIKKEHIGFLYLNSPKTKNALKIRRYEIDKRHS